MLVQLSMLTQVVDVLNMVTIFLARSSNLLQIAECG